MAVQWGLLKPYNVNEAIGQFSQGFLTPYVAGNELQKAKMNQQKVQQAQQLQQAQNRYAQTGDPKELMAVDPKMAMQIEEYVRTRPPEEMVKLAKATQYMQMARPYLNQQTWPTIRQQIVQMGAPENMVPPENASPEQLHQFVWGSDIMGASLKNMGKAFKGGEYVQTPEGLKQLPLNPEQQAKQFQEEATADLRRKQAEDPLGMKVPIRYQNAETNEVITTHQNDPRLTETAKSGAPLWREVPKPSAGQVPMSTIDKILDGIESGKFPFSYASKRGVSNHELLARAEERGIDLSKHERRYAALYNSAKQMTSERQNAFIQNANSFLNTVPELIKLGEDLKLTGYRPLNRVKLKWLMETRGNTPEGQLAAKYLSLSAGLNTEMVRIDSGGYAPTEEAWKQTFRQIDPNGALNVEMLTSQLSAVKTLVGNRLDVMNDSLMGVIEGKLPIERTQNQQKQPTGDTQAAKQRYEASKRAWEAEPDSDEKEEALRTLEASRQKYGF